MSLGSYWQTGNQDPRQASAPTETKRTGICFLILVPMMAHLLFSWMGMNPTDDGFFLGMGRRLLNGEIPHHDFITARPVGTGMLWMPVILLGGDYTIWASRFFVWFQFACIAWIWTGVISRMLQQALWPLERAAVALMAFAISAHTFIISPFPAIDGLWIVSLGLPLCMSRGSFRKFLGYGLVGAACLCKQNFLAVGPVLLVLLADWRRMRYWLALALPPLAYVVVMGLTGAFVDFKTQLTSHTELMGTGFRRFWHAYELYCGFLGAYFGLLVVSGEVKTPQWNLPLNLRRWLISLGTAFIFIPPAAGVAWSWDMSVKWSFVLFGMVVGATVFSLCHRDSAFAAIRAGFLVVVMMWTVSISIGYNCPALGGGLAVALLAIYLRTLLPTDAAGTRFRVAWRSGLLACTAVMLICFGIGRSWHIYMEQPAWKLTCSLNDVLPGGRMIRTNPVTFEYMKELHDLTQQVEGREYAILPDAAIYWVKARQNNPLPTSWPLDFELSTPALFNRFTQALETRRGRLTILVAKVKGFNLVNKAAPDWYAIVPYVESHFHKVGETQFWAVYE
jgi:hypothetical protein